MINYHESSKETRLLVIKMKNLIPIIIILLFGSNVAKAGISAHDIIEEISQVISDIPKFSDKDKRKEFTDILSENLNIKEILEKEVRIFIHAFDNPTLLIRSSGDEIFESNLHRNFFFSRFSLDDSIESLFIKLAFDDDHVQPYAIDQVSLETVKRNWRNFIGAMNEARKEGIHSIKQIDLEAAMISFLYNPNNTLYKDRKNPFLNPRQQEEDIYIYDPLEEIKSKYDLRYSHYRVKPNTVFSFFHNEFDPTYIISPYFRLDMRRRYMNIVISKLLSQKHLMDTKEIILKIWQSLSVRERFPQSYYYNGEDYVNNIFAFEENILESIERVFSMNKDAIKTEEQFYDKLLKEDGDPFLKALLRALEENDSLNDRFIPLLHDTVTELLNR